MLNTLVGLVIAALAVAHLMRRVRASRDAQKEEPTLFRDVASLLDRPTLHQKQAPDLPTMAGTFNGIPVQLRPIIDTLAVRKLPSLWLQVTLPVALPVCGTLDFMMRPAVATTFSNFDHLEHTLPSPPGWPADGLLRSDKPFGLPPLSTLSPAVALFSNPRMKELLLSPKGLRIVVQIAEADRSRYLVFRQAEFGEVVIDADLVGDILTRLARIRTALLQSDAVLAA